jgi:DNA-binding transcriptional LysR family regulator
MISLNQLKTFLEVAERGSIQEAADALVVSQPAVSAAISSLQRSVGAPLTERHGRGIALTEAGATYARYGRRVFALIEEARREAIARARRPERRISIAAVTTAAEHLVPELLQRYSKHTATSTVDLEVGNRSRVWDRLVHWEVDLVLAGRPPLDAPARSLAVRPHEFVVIGPRGWDDDVVLGSVTWLVREQGSGTRATSEEFFNELGIDPQRVSIGSNGAIAACVQAGLGVSLASRDGVSRELAAGLLREIPTPLTPQQREWHLAASSDRPLRDAVRNFVEYAVEACGFRRS